MSEVEPVRAPRILHLHSSFAAGGKELRAARLMNAFGPGIEHTLVSAQPDAYGAAVALDPGIRVAYPQNFPSLQGWPSFGRLLRIARAMQGYDLVLTYNWGAMDAVMARRLWGVALRLPPLIHHEDGFNEDETIRLKPLRNWFRRLALGSADAVIVPSRRLEEIARRAWWQPRRRVRLVTNGIALADFAEPPPPDRMPRLVKRPDDKWIGTLAGLRAVKNLPMMVRAFAPLAGEWQLVILGEGPERTAIEAEARALGVADRVHLPGFVSSPAKVVGLFDVFALSSHSEQFPISVLEAMAAGLPIASPAVGDVADMVCAENRPFITAPADEAGLSAALVALARDAGLREEIGAANRTLAYQRYDEMVMIAAYRRIYVKAMGRPI